jgi:hypothetical protein
MFEETVYRLHSSIRYSYSSEMVHWERRAESTGVDVAAAKGVKIAARAENIFLADMFGENGLDKPG